MSGLAALIVFVVLLAAPAAAVADTIHIDPVSQQLSPSRSAIGATIHATANTQGQQAAPHSSGTPTYAAAGGGSPEPPAVPTISSSSPLYRNPHPSGPGTFWYPPTGGQRCMYVPASNGICFNVTAPTPGRSPAPAVNPAALAASLAASMDLQVGGIAVSPSARMAGLTGAASWFWLSPPPGSRSLSISLAGESVTVSAAPSGVLWSFGDGAALTGGPGVPYRPGPAAYGSILHTYRTRCLPGDQGHDPYVLSGCGPDGYRAGATVGWSISYQASGPVSASGALPTRASSTSIIYPVSEARAFLTSGGGGA